ncbi:hypothetical protein GCM10027612_53730 [Microbispora bryophytorum subsp. camponoti]
MAAPATPSLGEGPALPAAANTSGMTTAIPTPISMNPAIAGAGARESTTSSPPSVASTPPPRTVATGPSRRTTASPHNRPAAIMQAKAVYAAAPTAWDAPATCRR